MSGAYIVLVTNDKAEVEVCEAYAGANLALGRAVHLAAQLTSNMSLVNVSPTEEKLDERSVRWVFLETNKHFVGVYFNYVQDSLRTSNDFIHRFTDATNVVPIAPYRPQKSIGEMIKEKLESEKLLDKKPEPILPFDDVEDDDLPAGWDFQEQPILMSDLKDEPFDVLESSDLDENQKWALTFARISKRPGYVFTNAFGQKIYQKEALAEVKAKSSVGFLMRSEELNFLDNFRQNLIDDINGY